MVGLSRHHPKTLTHSITRGTQKLGELCARESIGEKCVWVDEGSTRRGGAVDPRVKQVRGRGLRSDRDFPRLFLSPGEEKGLGVGVG